METPPNAPTPDVELQPTSDYGTLGPGTDIKLDQSAGAKPGTDPKVKFQVGVNFKLGAPSGQRTVPPLPAQANQAIRVFAILLGAMFAFGILISRQLMNTRRAENEVQRTTSSRGSANTRRETQKYDSAAQHEAEQLLQRALRNDSTAITQIETRAPAWRGRIQLTPQMTSLITAGLNARDLRARAATVQADLAAMNVVEDSSSVDRLAGEAESTDHATRVWAIWTLGLLANRGIQTEHIIALLTAHLSDTDVESRHWAAEALSYTGSDASIPPLLQAMHDDPSPLVRERAACGLAESGMLTNEQRRTTIPTLMIYIDDTSLDPATRSWTYHALRDITGQNLPDDSATWRRWYESSR